MPKSNDTSNEMSQSFENFKNTVSMTNLSDAYFRKDGQNLAENPNGMEIITKKRAIVREIIFTLCFSRDGKSIYSPAETVKAIKKYICEEEAFGRILYSQITSSIFDLDKTSGVDINGNLEVLIDYITQNLENDTDYAKLVDFAMRLYDHVQLAQAQQKVIQDTTQKSQEEIKGELIKTRQQAIADFSQKLNDEARVSQRGYVATLGIFASIMVAIFSNLSLTKSIIDNFHDGLLSVVLLSTIAGTFVIIVLHMLLAAIGNMLDKKIEGIAAGHYVLAFWVVSFICLLVLAKIGN